MSPAFRFTQRDLWNPADWPGWGFELLWGDQSLVALPPSIGLDELGTTDGSSYDHPPFSDVWFRLGDGVPQERPLLRLSGQHTYRTVEEALDHVAQVEQAARVADRLLWQGRLVAQLDNTFGGTVRTRTGATFVNTTFNITLSTLTRVTRQSLAQAMR